MNHDEGLFSGLLGKPSDPRLEILASESLLSKKAFPREILSESLRTQLESLGVFLNSLERRDAQELAFAALLRNHFSPLEVARHDS